MENQKMAELFQEIDDKLKNVFQLRTIPMREQNDQSRMEVIGSLLYLYNDSWTVDNTQVIIGVPSTNSADAYKKPSVLKKFSKWLTLAELGHLIPDGSNITNSKKFPQLVTSLMDKVERRHGMAGLGAKVRTVVQKERGKVIAGGGQSKVKTTNTSLPSEMTEPLQPDLSLTPKRTIPTGKQLPRTPSSPEPPSAQAAGPETEPPSGLHPLSASTGEDPQFTAVFQPVKQLPRTPTKNVSMSSNNSLETTLNESTKDRIGSFYSPVVPSSQLKRERSRRPPLISASEFNLSQSPIINNGKENVGNKDLQSPSSPNLIRSLTSNNSNQAPISASEFDGLSVKLTPKSTAPPPPGRQLARTPVSAQAPLPVSAQEPLPVSTQAPLPVSAQAPLPVSAQASLPVSTQAPLLVSAQAPLPGSVQAPLPINPEGGCTSAEDKESSTAETAMNNDVPKIEILQSETIPEYVMSKPSNHLGTDSFQEVNSVTTTVEGTPTNNVPSSETPKSSRPLARTPVSAQVSVPVINDEDSKLIHQDTISVCKSQTEKILQKCNNPEKVSSESEAVCPPELESSNTNAGETPRRSVPTSGKQLARTPIIASMSVDKTNEANTETAMEEFRRGPAQALESNLTSSHNSKVKGLELTSTENKELGRIDNFGVEPVIKKAKNIIPTGNQIPNTPDHRLLQCNVGYSNTLTKRPEENACKPVFQSTTAQDEELKIEEEIKRKLEETERLRQKLETLKKIEEEKRLLEEEIRKLASQDKGGTDVSSFSNIEGRNNKCKSVENYPEELTKQTQDICFRFRAEEEMQKKNVSSMQMEVLNVKEIDGKGAEKNHSNMYENRMDEIVMKEISQKEGGSIDILDDLKPKEISEVNQSVSEELEKENGTEFKIVDQNYKDLHNSESKSSSVERNIELKEGGNNQSVPSSKQKSLENIKSDDAKIKASEKVEFNRMDDSKTNKENGFQLSRDCERGSETDDHVESKEEMIKGELKKYEPKKYESSRQKNETKSKGSEHKFNVEAKQETIEHPKVEEVKECHNKKVKPLQNMTKPKSPHQEILIKESEDDLSPFCDSSKSEKPEKREKPDEKASKLDGISERKESKVHEKGSKRQTKVDGKGKSHDLVGKENNELKKPETREKTDEKASKLDGISEGKESKVHVKGSKRQTKVYGKGKTHDLEVKEKNELKKPDTQSAARKQASPGVNHSERVNERKELINESIKRGLEKKEERKKLMEQFEEKRNVKKKIRIGRKPTAPTGLVERVKSDQSAIAVNEVKGSAADDPHLHEHCEIGVDPSTESCQIPENVASDDSKESVRNGIDKLSKLNGDDNVQVHADDLIKNADKGLKETSSSAQEIIIAGPTTKISGGDTENRENIISVDVDLIKNGNTKKMPASNSRQKRESFSQVSEASPAKKLNLSRVEQVPDSSRPLRTSRSRKTVNYCETKPVSPIVKKPVIRNAPNKVNTIDINNTPSEEADNKRKVTKKNVIGTPNGKCPVKTNVILTSSPSLTTPKQDEKPKTSSRLSKVKEDSEVDKVSDKSKNAGSKRSSTGLNDISSPKMPNVKASITDSVRNSSLKNPNLKTSTTDGDGKPSHKKLNVEASSTENNEKSKRSSRSSARQPTVTDAKKKNAKASEVVSSAVLNSLNVSVKATRGKTKIDESDITTNSARKRSLKNLTPAKKIVESKLEQNTVEEKLSENETSKMPTRRPARNAKKKTADLEGLTSSGGPPSPCLPAKDTSSKNSTVRKKAASKKSEAKVPVKSSREDVAVDTTVQVDSDPECVANKGPSVENSKDTSNSNETVETNKVSRGGNKSRSKISDNDLLNADGATNTNEEKKPTRKRKQNRPRRSVGGVLQDIDDAVYKTPDSITNIPDEFYVTPKAQGVFGPVTDEEYSTPTLPATTQAKKRSTRSTRNR